MSGRKDYSYALTAVRLVPEQAAREARAANREQARIGREAKLREQRAAAAKRSADVKRRLEEARRQAREGVARLADEKSQQLAAQQAEQQQGNAVRLQAAAEKNRANAESANRVAAENQAANLMQLAEELGLPQPTTQSSSNNEIEEARAERLLVACAEQQQLNEELESSTANLKSWLETFENSDDVQHFAKGRFERWQAASEKLLSQTIQTGGDQQHLTSVQQAVLEAERIETEAIDITEKFEQRNSVLKDIIESLQEVGFFVQNPEYVDPTRPDLAVIIRANRADQTMEAKVDLNAAVESDWQGVHGMYCTNTFFDFVKQMNARGINISSDNPQLAPRLNQMDAMELPGNRELRLDGQ